MDVLKKARSIGVAVIWNNFGTHILIDRRLPGSKFGGLWEFPGGKIEPDETVQECIRREVKEELGIIVEVGDHLITIDYHYDNFQIQLIVHNCLHKSGIPQPLECTEIAWVLPTALPSYQFPPANNAIVKKLQCL